MKLPSSVIFWLFDYLTSRLQYVRLNELLPSAIRYSFSTLFVALYTADCRNIDESCPLVKFVDDTELVGKK